MSHRVLVVVTCVAISGASVLSWIAIARLRTGDSVSESAASAPLPVPSASAREEEPIATLFGRLTESQQKTVQRSTDPEDREFFTRVFAYADRLTGAEHETQFAVDAIGRYLSPPGAQTADRAYYDQLHAFVSLGLLSKAEAQAGLPQDQRAIVLGMCERLAATRDEEIMLMTAAFLHACRERAELGVPLKRLYESLTRDEMVQAELPAQIRILEDARRARKK